MPAVVEPAQVGGVGGGEVEEDLDLFRQGGEGAGCEAEEQGQGQQAFHGGSF